ncbi:MAG: hypothetical protein RBU23_13355 [Candidatus Auribacterota bacterium]|jgi:hypothetical protein|nr:hypothetical protein [Candidatus Auribacterota bacterium]
METTKELRIGNLVEDHNGVHYVIYAISSNCVIVDLPFGSIHRWFDISEIKPIPLTEEWMVKLRFRKRIGGKHDSYYTYYLKRISIGNDIKITFYENRNMKYTLIENEHHEMFLGKYENCVYVHQLQNLFFALTGKELA